jgi:non-specific serine/threonine protein kinase
VQLFTDRALLVRPDFQVTPQNAPALASICRRLDGIPLAIELAAARGRSLSINEIDAKLDQRFRLLTGGSRTALPRQQTLRALIDWSYDLLSAAEQALFQRLSVFAGGWSLKAAEEVCGDETVDRDAVLELLTSLADKSLVLAEERDGATRYRLLETVRQYAREKLIEGGGEARWRDQHLAYFLALTHETEPLLKGAVQMGLDQLDTEHDNLRMALDWAESGRGDSAAGLQIAAAVWWFWEQRGHLREGRRRLSRLLDEVPDTQALAIRAKALRGAGALARAQGDYPVAEALHKESLAIRRELGDQGGIALALGSLGVVAGERGNYDAARALQEESLAIQRQTGDRASVAMVLSNLSEVAYHQGDRVTARTRAEESLAIYRELDNQWGIAQAMEHLAQIALADGDFTQARSLQRDVLLILRELGNPLGIAWSLEAIGHVALTLGAPDRAARIWGSAERLREEIGAPLSPVQRGRHESHIASARAAMRDDSALDAVWQEGRAMTLEQAIEYALNDNGKTSSHSPDHN